MSAFGTKQTFPFAPHMSALGGNDTMQDVARYDFPVLQFRKLSLALLCAARKAWQSKSLI
jgi:hypothetical protein